MVFADPVAQPLATGAYYDRLAASYHLSPEKLESDYDPTDRMKALSILAEAETNNTLLTGLIYVSPNVPSIFEFYDIPDEPLNRLTEARLRPSRESLEKLNRMML